MNRWIAIVLLAGAGCLPGQVPSGTAHLDFSKDQTAPETKLYHFARVDEGIYKGSKPHSDADYRFLQSLHVKYIVDLQVIPWWYHWEKKKAKRYGIELIPVGINASPFSPSERHIESVMAILRDERCHPVYFHCALGRDRTALIAALYKMYFLGMSPADARSYLYEAGYKDGWVRSGLTRYLKNHPTRPPVEPAADRSQCAAAVPAGL